MTYTADDCISREAVDRIISKWLSHPDYELKDHIYSMTEKIHNLPSVTPQEPTTKNDLGINKFDKAINQSDLEEWIMETFPDWCEGDVRLIMNHMDEMPSVTPQEPFEPMVEINLDYVIKQKYIEREVLDKLKVEIKKQQYGYMGGTDYEEGVRFGLMLAHQILDKYKAETEDKNA